LLDDKNAGIQMNLRNLSSKTSDYTLWKAIKKLKQPQQTSLPIMKQDGYWTKTDQEKADTFAEYLVTSDTSDIRLGEKKSFDRRKSTNTKHVKQRLTKNEIRVTISKYLNRKKTSEYYLITGRILKELPELGINYLIRLFDDAHIESKLLPQWKIAQIITIPKSNKDVKSYRPISLLPKLFEKLLLQKLMHVIEEKRVISNH